MASKTKMLALVREWDWRHVRSDLAASPELIEFRGEKGRNWLHLACMVDGTKRAAAARDGIRTAEVLLDAGLAIDAAAFEEGKFRATPLWHAVAFGKNVALAEFLLKRGCDPNHCLFAAAWNDDVPMIKLLAKHGANIALDDGSSPFLGAIAWSRFVAAEAFLRLGADVNLLDDKNMTALHHLLKKGSDIKYVRMLITYGARTDIKNAAGDTAGAIMLRKRDPAFRALA